MGADGRRSGQRLAEQAMSAGPAWRVSEMLRMLPPEARRKYGALVDSVDDAKARLRAIDERAKVREHDLTHLRNKFATCAEDRRPDVEKEIAFAVEGLQKLDAERG